MNTLPRKFSGGGERREAPVHLHSALKEAGLVVLVMGF